VVVVSVNSNNNKATRLLLLGVRHQPQAACLVPPLPSKVSALQLQHPKALEVVSEHPLLHPVACLELQPPHPKALVVVAVSEVPRVDTEHRHRLLPEACLEHQLLVKEDSELLHQLREEDSLEHPRRDNPPLEAAHRRRKVDLEDLRVDLEHQLPRRIQVLVEEVELSGNHSSNNSSSHPPLVHQLQLREEACLEHQLPQLVAVLVVALELLLPQLREACLVPLLQPKAVLGHPRLRLQAVDSLEGPPRHRLNSNKVREEHEWPRTKLPKSRMAAARSSCRPLRPCRNTNTNRLKN
jgi:hypothetical protein